MKINNGPFAGTIVPAHELQTLFNYDGTTTDWWPVAFRTPVFLDKYSPSDGWCIEVRNEQGSFNLPDYRNGVGGEILTQPTQLFVATLKRNGIIVNQASSLEVIDGAKAWERGETNARGRLYEAMGLPGSTKTISPSDNAFPSGGSNVTALPVRMPGLQSPKEVDHVEGEALSSAPPETTSTHEQPSDQPEKPKTNAMANLLQQINTMAKIKGIVVPDLSDLEAAKSFYRDLLTGKVTS